ncbi:MAG TPA: FkbM family methyltransferase [Usitatibacter sp.]|nr:FkbM family methyltransferase [Usitatibacter sp.]
MKQFGGWLLPDHEEHLIGWMKKTNDVVDGRQRYQGRKQDAAMKWCKDFRTAVDVGAHVGLWSYFLAQRFAELHSFEPVADHRECFMANVEAPTVVLHPYALGEHDGLISISTEKGSSGNSFISGAGDIPLRRLDDFNLQDVDFIKLDCEGGELPALRGGEETIKRCRPCVIVEQKPGRAQKFGLPETGAVAYLRFLGARLRSEMSGDFVLSWD